MANTKFFQDRNFEMNDFINSYKTIYDLMYEGLMDMEYGYLYRFEEMQKTIFKKACPERMFYKIFCGRLNDVPTSDRELIAFVVTWELYDRKFMQNNFA